MYRVVFAEGYYQSFTGAQKSMMPLLTETASIDARLLAPATGELTRRVAERGVPVDIVEYDDDLDQFGESIVDQNVLGKLKTSTSLAEHYWNVLRYLYASDVDALYCNNLRSLLLFAPPAKCLRIPIVWYVRTDEPQGVFDRVGIRLADQLVTISDNVKKRFDAKDARAYRDKIQTVYTGVDTEKFDPESVEELPLDVDENAMRVVEVATITERKGQHDLVEALNSVDDTVENCVVLFAGEAPEGETEYKEQLERKIERADLDVDVEFLGWVDDVPALLQSTDVFVLPSYNEGLPRSILEAMAMEVPVVTTDAGGAEELVRDGKDGFVVPIQETQELSKRLAKLCNDEQKRNEMGVAARERIDEAFTIERYVESFEDLLVEGVIKNE